MRLTDFRNASHRILSKAIAEALEPVAAKYGVTLTPNGGLIGASSGMIKIKVELEAAPGQPARSDTLFGYHAPLLGLQASDKGRSFSYKSVLYTIKDLNPRAPKFPVIAERVRDGAPFRFPIDVVKRGLPARAA
ncbi:hypothetical protein [Ancylobacter rudongensis]|uniref:Uncharacterized protein n=1 Tax=Ancylobacter rudongensis TaxID=177413 RepID=A0A1G4UPD2_9HYPH|nr:hypothetical protein [Ancylobacter rudongensis]SCW95404.1 hypothetical protein SAMN05660859_0019 [Ancylobacter rudongensis]